MRSFIEFSEKILEDSWHSILDPEDLYEWIKHFHENPKKYQTDKKPKFRDLLREYLEGLSEAIRIRDGGPSSYDTRDFKEMERTWVYLLYKEMWKTFN